VGQLVEIVAVDVDSVDEDSPLIGASVDSPQAGRQMAATALEIGGWALGRAGRPERIELVLGDTALARGAWCERSDLALAFPDIPEAAASGFEIVVDVSTVPAEAELGVRAGLGEAVLPFARVRLRRHWRDRPDLARPPLVSIVVIGDPPGERAVEHTLASVGAQRHPLTEVVVLSPTASSRSDTPLLGSESGGVRRLTAESGGAALRNEGIRRSNGDHILFVSAGSALAPDALVLGVEMLARNREAVAVVDGDETDVVAGLYRRAGFEELEGFAEDAGADCDLELAGRASRYGAIFAPGALVAGGR
jgi:hypothetical protein